MEVPMNNELPQMDEVSTALMLVFLSATVVLTVYFLQNIDKLAGIISFAA